MGHMASVTLAGIKWKARAGMASVGPVSHPRDSTSSRAHSSSNKHHGWDLLGPGACGLIPLVTFHFSLGLTRIKVKMPFCNLAHVSSYQGFE